MKHIGFIGTGIMGREMARHLMNKGFSVSVYNRTREKAAELLAAGAQWADTPGACAQNADAVITMVGYPADVEAVYLGDGGIVEAAPKGCVLIDMTTSSPQLAVKIYEAAAGHGLYALDAPVSGGDVGAKNAALTIMVGGDEAAYAACLPIFEAMGKRVAHMGGPGMGQHTKMANQIALAGSLAGVCEAISYARGAGLSPEAMLAAIGAGAAGSWQLENMGPRMLKGDFAPGFFMRHYIKDMRIAEEEAARAGVELGVLDHVLAMFDALAAEGMGGLGTQALIKYYEKHTDAE